MLGTLTSTIQTILPARLSSQISTLKKKFILAKARLRKNVYLGQSATESLSQGGSYMVDKQFRIDKRSVHNSISLAHTFANRYIHEMVECSVPGDENRWSVIKKGTRMPYQFPGISSYKVRTVDLQQNEEVQVITYSNRQFDGPELPFEMEGTRSLQLVAFSKEIWEYLFKHQIMIMNNWHTGSEQTRKIAQSGNYVHKVSKEFFSVFYLFDPRLFNQLPGNTREKQIQTARL